MDGIALSDVIRIETKGWHPYQLHKEGCHPFHFKVQIQLP